jgi:excisionase family DNA binding protein
VAWWILGSPNALAEDPATEHALFRIRPIDPIRPASPHALDPDRPGHRRSDPRRDLDIERRLEHLVLVAPSDHSSQLADATPDAVPSATMQSHRTTTIDALTATFAALTDVPAALADVARQLQDLTKAVRALEARLPPPLVSVRAAAKILDCSIATIRRKVAAGEVSYIRIGRTVRVDLSKLKTMDRYDVAELVGRAQRGNNP